MQTKEAKAAYHAAYYRRNSTASRRGRNDGRCKEEDYYKDYNRLYCKENPEKRLLWSARDRAKKKGLEFNIEELDVSIPEYCPMLGIKLESGGNTDSSPSLDRIDNSKGYIKGNVHVISRRANTIKSSATTEELRKIVEYLETL